MSQNAYQQGLDKNAANYVPLSPLSFIERTAMVYPTRTSVVHGTLIYTWSQTYERCRRLASALVAHGVKKGDTVACMLPNVPSMFEAHFGVPMTGAVLNTLNTRLDADAIAFMLQHGEAKVLITDPEFAGVVRAALELLPGDKPLVIDALDPEYPGTERVGTLLYEDFLAGGNPDFQWKLPEDEWDAIALNYTSGTTGNPKGVVYHHRGAYLNAASNIISWGMPQHSSYLWTLPMFHCNGWCFPWTMAANAGVNVCLRKVDPALIYELIRRHKVTHMCGAPIVYGMLINAPEGLRAGIEHSVAGLIAGAAPPAAIIEGADEIAAAAEVRAPGVVARQAQNRLGQFGRRVGLRFEAEVGKGLHHVGRRHRRTDGGGSTLRHVRRGLGRQEEAARLCSGPRRAQSAHDATRSHDAGEDLEVGAREDLAGIDDAQVGEFAGAKNFLSHGFHRRQVIGNHRVAQACCKKP